MESTMKMSTECKFGNMGNSMRSWMDISQYPAI